MRVSRQWRNLKLRKWSGFGHEGRVPQSGEMAIFCPTCPQPDINLPEDWINDPGLYVVPVH